MEEKKEEVKVNGEVVSQEELEKMKESQDANTKLVETGKGEFVQRLSD